MAKHTLDERLTCLLTRNLFLVTLYGEARGEPIEGQVGVASVIINRAGYPDQFRDKRLRAALMRWAQFSTLWPELSGSSNYQDMMDMASVIHNGEIDQLGVQAQLMHQLEWVVDGVMAGHLQDNTHGAKHYFASSIDPPYWAKKPGVRSVTLGRHEFWIGVA